MGRTSDAADRLKAAALDLIHEESYGSITIDDICKRAEVKKGSFYYFFESKVDLTIAALEKLWESDWKPSLDDTFSASRPPLERLQVYLNKIYDKHSTSFLKTGKVFGCPVCSVGSEVSNQEDLVSAKVREIISRKRRYYESAIRDAIASGVMAAGDPVQKAQTVACLIEGAVGQARIMGEPEPLRLLMPTAFQLLGVKPELIPAPVAAPAAPAPATAGR